TNSTRSVGAVPETPSEPPDARAFLMTSAQEKLNSAMKGDGDRERKRRRKDAKKKRSKSTSSEPETESEDAIAVKQSVFCLGFRELNRKQQNTLDDWSTKQIAYAFACSSKFIIPAELYDIGGEQD
ncbi:unnamed protein product, partial [Symbiodinium necroappetens]